VPLIKCELKTLKPRGRVPLVLGLCLTAEGTGKLFVSSHHHVLGSEGARVGSCN
jgi:hypothetical protein